MHDDLNELLIFAKVVQEGSFTAAAKALRMPKATVSRKVQVLETRLGVALLHRTTRASTLTEAGAVLFEHAQRLSQGVKEARGAVEQLISGPQGVLRISAPHSFAVTWVTPLLAAFYARFPHVRIELLLGHEPLDVLNKEIDVALRLGHLPDSGLVARRLALFRLHMVASPSYLQVHGSPQHPHDLVQHQALVLPLARHEGRHAWRLREIGSAHALLQPFTVNPILEASDPEALYAPMLGGMGVLQVMDVHAREWIATGRAIPVLPAWSGPDVPFNAVFPKGHGRSPKVRAFLDFLIENLNFK